MSQTNEPAAGARAPSGPKFELGPADDYMAIVLSCTVPPRDPELLTPRIRNELARMGVEQDERLDEAVRRYREAVQTLGNHLEGVVLLEGTPPLPPVDESIRWNGNFHAKGFQVDPETGRADYRRRLADVSVEENQLLAEVLPGQLGQNGQDVFGRVVPPRPPRPARIREGRNVRHNPAERAYYAETSGRFRFVAGVLAVDDVFRVEGDAGLRTGNINHPGALVVTRDIQSGAEVIAQGDIDVGENIEDATVESGGSVTVQGGISCKDRGSIRAAGNVHARYLRNVDIEAGGDVYVDREINQCTIRTRGAVIVKQGRIVGGSIIALRGVETGDLGSDACIPSEIVAGKDYTKESVLAEKRAALENARQIMMRLRESVAPLRAKQHALTPELKLRLASLTEELQKREAVFQDAERDLNDLLRAAAETANYQIYVHGKIYPDNLVQVGAQIKRIPEPVDGPLRIGLKDGKLAFFRLKGNESLQGTL